MVFGIAEAITWILFLALFPLTFFWLRRAWRIIVKKDFSEVALKGGEPPQNAVKYAPFTAANNLVCGLILTTLIFGILIGRLSYETWTSIAGMTIWGKFIVDFIISRQAHPIVFKKRKKN